jgi:chromosomal replication initiation ATPase DnaA
MKNKWIDILKCVKPGDQTMFVQAMKHVLTARDHKALSQMISMADCKFDKIQTAFEVVSKVTDMPIALIRTPSRRRELVDARRMIAVILCRNSGMPITRIAAHLDKDHATILSLKRGHDNLTDVDTQYRQAFEEAERMYLDRMATITEPRKDESPTVDRMMFKEFAIEA